MASLELILIFVLQFEGISALLIYRRPGQDATLSCGNVSPNDPTCSTVRWLHSDSLSQVVQERSARLVNATCSLVINKITAEDAGLYTCMWRGSSWNVHLIVLTISPSPPEVDPKTDDEVTLKCSLLRHIDLRPCRQNSIRWVDETGSVLLGDGDGYTFIGQAKCDSVLTVRHRSGPNRRYTCQFIDAKGTLAIEADYTPVFKDATGWSPLSIVMLALRIAGLILMIVITVLIIRNRCKTKLLDSDNEVGHGDVQYENVQASPAAARLI